MVSLSPLHHGNSPQPVYGASSVTALIGLVTLTSNRFTGYFIQSSVLKIKHGHTHTNSAVCNQYLARGHITLRTHTGEAFGDFSSATLSLNQKKH